MNRGELLCQVLGHRYDPEGERHGYYDCERCEATAYDPLTTIYSRLRDWMWWKKWLFEYRWSRVKRWARCSDCGRRFGRRHSDDCLPF